MPLSKAEIEYATGVLLYLSILSRPISRSECRWAGTRPDLGPTVKNEFFEFSCMCAFCL
eukprot:COSAG05_NODE_2239_length_3353_cov_423.015980_8_plen_59_part_00